MKQTLNGRPSMLDCALFTTTTKQPTPTIGSRRLRPVGASPARPRAALKAAPPPAPARQRPVPLRTGPAFTSSPVRSGETWEGTQVLRASDADGQPGLYIVVHMPTEKRYTGCSKDIGNRYRQHASHLRTWLHHCRALQNLWSSTAAAEWAFVVIARGPSTVDDETRAIWQAGPLALNKPVGSTIHITNPSVAAHLGVLPAAWR